MEPCSTCRQRLIISKPKIHLSYQVNVIMSCKDDYLELIILISCISSIPASEQTFLGTDPHQV